MRPSHITAASASCSTESMAVARPLNGGAGTTGRRARRGGGTPTTSAISSPPPPPPRRRAASAAAARAAAPRSSSADLLASAPTRADADALLNGDSDAPFYDDEAAEARAVADYVSHLNAEFGIPGLVAFDVSPADGAPRARLRHPPSGFEASVSLHGAVVTSLVRPGVGELLYSEDARGNAVGEGQQQGQGQRSHRLHPRRPPAFGVAPAFPMVGRSDGVAAAAGASWAQLPPDGILRHAHWSVAASGAATVRGASRRGEGEGEGESEEEEVGDGDDGGEDNDGVSDPAPSVCLVCSDSPATRALWPHAFSVAYTISLMATDDFPDEAEEEEEEQERRRREQERRRRAAAEAAEAAAAEAAAAAAAGEVETGEASSAKPSARGSNPGAGGSGKFNSASGGSSTPAGIAREAAAAAREAAARDVAGSLPGASSSSSSSSSSSQQLVLPHDFPELSPEDDPDGTLEGVPREDPPPPPPPPMQLRLVMEVVNPLAAEGGEKGKAKGKGKGKGKGEGADETGSDNDNNDVLVFGAAVSAAVAIHHAPLAEVRGGAGRVILESRGREGASSSSSRAPELGVAPEGPLSLAGTRDVEVVFVGGRVLENENDKSGNDAAASSLGGGGTTKGGGGEGGRPSALSPGSLVLDTGDFRHELELIPRRGFRDTGVRCPPPKQRRRVPGLARARSTVDDAYAAALAAGSAFAHYPSPEGQLGLGSNPAFAASAATGLTGDADADNSGSSRETTHAGRHVAVGLVGEVARPVSLKPGEVFVGEAVIRIHDLSHLPRAEEDWAMRRSVASRPAFRSRVGEEPYPEGEEPVLGAEDEDITVVDVAA